MLNVFDSSFVFPDFVVVCFGSLAVRKAAYGLCIQYTLCDIVVQH